MKTVALICALFVGCAPQVKTRGYIVYVGPMQRRFIDGYSRSYPQPWPFTRDNSYFGRERKFSAESVPEYLNSNPFDKP